MQTKHSLITDSNPNYQKVFQEFDRQSPNRDTWYFYSVFCQCVSINNFYMYFICFVFYKIGQNKWYKIAKQYGFVLDIYSKIQKNAILA